MAEQYGEETPEESKFKVFFRGTLVTVLLWAIVGYLPTVLAPQISTASLWYTLLLCLLLFLGWHLAGFVVKWKSVKCIQANLYIFAGLRTVGVLQVLSRVARSLSFYTGQYTADIYGVAYSDYPLVYGGAVLAGALFIFLCFKFAKITRARYDSEYGTEEPQEA